MNKFQEDTELRQLIKGFRLQSPGDNFSSKVMDHIHEEKRESERVKAEKIIGPWFWIVLASFAGLCAAVFFVSESDYDTSLISGFLQGTGEKSLSTYYTLFVSFLDTVPTSVAGIMLALSLLVLLDKFFLSRLRLD